MSVTDLAEHHKPLTDLFPSLESIDPAPLRLSEEQLDQYERDGYVSGIKIFEDAQVDALRSELETFFQSDHPGNEYWHEYHSNESNDPSNVLFHALGAWRIGRAFHDSLWNPRFTVPASDLLGGSVRFWHDQLFCKPAKHGGVVAWHQDYSYWTRTEPMAHLTCWIGLDDSDRENGCLQYIPGSHKWDLLPITGLAGDMEAIKKVLTDEQWEQFNKPVAIEMKKGEGSFHHPLMVHGSYENRTDRPRRALVLNACHDGVRSNSDEALLSGATPVPKGHPLSGAFFPLLLDSAQLS